MTKPKKIPPDGGYGWVIVFATALNNFLVVPLIHCFGLIFKDTFRELNLSATQGSLIINLNVAFGLMVGLLNGALLKVWGCRKVAILGAILLTVGVVLTSFSKTFTHFIISYGLITSLGMGICQSAYGLALITYFINKRSYAMGLAVTITGFGPIVIPQIIGFLLQIHTPEGVTLIFGAICAHVFIAAVLLQPVEWHLKDDPSQTKDEEVDLLKEQKAVKLQETKDEEVNLLKEQKEKKPQETNEVDLFKEEEPQKGKTDSVWRRISKTMVRTFDLDLLKDPIFVNIMMGMALAIFAELNFTVLTPFMLDDFGLDTGQIATFLSTLGVADIIFRFCAPYIGNYFTKPPRLMYAYSLCLLIVTRFTFIMSKNFYVLLVVALGLGVAKGIRKVYMTLVIPAHVPIEKLASASGMEMMMNGFCIIIGGPLIGAVRDITGSYTLCVILMNCVTFTTIAMWVTEAIVSKCRRKKKEKTAEEGSS